KGDGPHRAGNGDRWADRARGEKEGEAGADSLRFVGDLPTYPYHPPVVPPLPKEKKFDNAHLARLSSPVPIRLQSAIRSTTMDSRGPFLWGCVRLVCNVNQLLQVALPC